MCQLPLPGGCFYPRLHRKGSTLLWGLSCLYAPLSPSCRVLLLFTTYLFSVLPCLGKRCPLRSLPFPSPLSKQGLGTQRKGQLVRMGPKVTPLPLEAQTSPSPCSSAQCAAIRAFRSCPKPHHLALPFPIFPVVSKSVLLERKRGFDIEFPPSTHLTSETFVENTGRKEGRREQAVPCFLCQVHLLSPAWQSRGQDWN